jgi:hypothetical protein
MHRLPTETIPAARRPLGLAVESDAMRLNLVPFDQPGKVSLQQVSGTASTNFTQTEVGILSESLDLYPIGQRFEKFHRLVGFLPFHFGHRQLQRASEFSHLTQVVAGLVPAKNTRKTRENPRFSSLTRINDRLYLDLEVD